MVVRRVANPTRLGYRALPGASTRDTEASLPDCESIGGVTGRAWGTCTCGHRGFSRELCGIDDRHHLVDLAALPANCPPTSTAADLVLT